MNRREKGKNGEELAYSFLRNKDYRIVERNYRKGPGEIDLIALDKDGTLVFIEVKYWDFYSYREIEYAVNQRKQRKIIQTSKCFLAWHPEFKNNPMRYDVLFIGREGEVKEHLNDAFYGENVLW